MMQPITLPGPPTRPLPIGRPPLPTATVPDRALADALLLSFSPARPSLSAASHMTPMAPTHDDDLLLPRAPDAELDALRALVSSASLNEDPAQVQIRAGALFARLKALNRAANHATRAHKQATADARHEMDQTYLGLQNLLYEKRHLEREIEKCRQFAYVSARARVPARDS